MARDLDEYSERELYNEIRRRIRSRCAGQCDYCSGSNIKKLCRFPERHRAGCRSKKILVKLLAQLKRYGVSSF
jgi:hypothetical protein